MPRWSCVAQSMGNQWEPPKFITRRCDDAARMKNFQAFPSLQFSRDLAIPFAAILVRLHLVLGCYGSVVFLDSSAGKSDLGWNFDHPFPSSSCLFPDGLDPRDEATSKNMYFMWRQANLMGFGTWLSWSQPWFFSYPLRDSLTWNLFKGAYKQLLDSCWIVAGCCWLAVILGETVSSKKRGFQVTGAWGQAPWSWPHVIGSFPENPSTKACWISSATPCRNAWCPPTSRGSYLGYTVTSWCTHTSWTSRQSWLGMMIKSIPL